MKRTAGSGMPLWQFIEILWQFIERVFGFQLAASEVKHDVFLKFNAGLCFSTHGIPLPRDLARVGSAAVTRDRQALVV